MNKFENLPNTENLLPSTPNLNSLSRKLNTNTPLADRTSEIINSNNPYLTELKPFQVKIDTHIIHRETAPPLTQATTTFIDQNSTGVPPLLQYPMTESHRTPNSHSPIKFHGNNIDSGRPSFDGGIKPGTKIGDYVYSPYQGKMLRPQ